MKKDNLELVEQSTRVIVTEYATSKNNFCIEEGRSIIRRLASMVNRIDNRRLTLNVSKMSYNCDSLCCPRIELQNTNDGKMILVITDGNKTHAISPSDNINSLRKIFEYATN